MSLRMAKNPTGGVTPQHVMERHSLDSTSVVSVVYTVAWDSLSDYGPMISANRPVRSRMRGGVGRDG